MSGVNVSDEVIKTYNDIKLRKREKEARYMCMKIDIDKGLIVVEKIVDKWETPDQKEEFKEFKDSLPLQDCRYYLLDLDVVTPNGAKKPSLFLITWTDDSGSVKGKMKYASSKGALVEKN